MLTYTLSQREKALLLVLAVILVVVAWFVFVFQRTADDLNALEGEIVTADAEAAAASVKADRMHAMQAVIDKYKAQGASATPVPAFDNMTPLMTELNNIMARTTTYTLSFDDLDTETSKEYVLRGVKADFSCDSFSSAELVVSALANGTYPCSIDSVTISDGSAGRSRTSGSGGASSVSASVHVTFFEKPSSSAGATGAAG